MIKADFILRKMPGMNLVIPTGSAIKSFNGALVLNDTGAFIFELLKQGLNEEEVACKLTEKYKVEDEEARQDIRSTIDSLKEAGVAE